MKLYGKNPVLERIKLNPGTIRKLYLQKRKDLSEIVREAKSAGLDFESADKNELLRLSGDANTQGVIAVVDEYRYTSFSKILSKYQFVL